MKMFLMLKIKKLPYTQVFFTLKKLCEYMFEKWDLTKRVVERVGGTLCSILSSKGENSPKFSILEAHMQSIHPEHVQPIFGI